MEHQCGIAKIGDGMHDEMDDGLVDLSTLSFYDLARLDDVVITRALERLLPGGAALADRLWNDGARRLYA